MAKFTGESCKCTPRRECTPEAEQESIFKEIEKIRAGEGVSFNVCCVLRATTKKGLQLFFLGGGEK